MMLLPILLAAVFLSTGKLLYCLTTYQLILETKRSCERKVNLKNLKFLKKSIERFENYALIVKEDQNVYKTSNKNASIPTNQTVLSANQLELSPWSFTHVFKQIETTMRLNCMSKVLRFPQITAKQKYCPFFTVFLIIETSSQDILITLLQISLKLHKYRGCYWRKNFP